MYVPSHFIQPCKNGHYWQWTSSVTDETEHPPSGQPCQCGAYLWADDDETILRPETPQEPLHSPE